MLNIVFTGGGTGGHIYPGLAVVEELREMLDNSEFNSDGQKNYKIFWIGAKSGMDKELVSKSSVVDQFIGIPCGKLRRYFSLQNFFDLFKIVAGLIKSYFVLAKLKPQVVFSKGGFVSVPPCYAAKALKIPVFTHECDFTTGLATRLNTKVAKKLFVSYAETKESLSPSIQNKTIVSGNPVRPAFFNSDAKKGLEFIASIKNINVDDIDKSKPVLLVVGGSLGAKQINDLVWNNVDWLCQHFTVIHQTGKQDEIKQFDNPSYFQTEFIYSQMADVMKCCDIILSRAGANFLWEACAQNKPMVLIPLGGEGSRGDQIDNASYFEKKGCAIVIDCIKADDALLKDALEKVLDKDVRSKMSECAKILCGEKRATKIIAENILSELKAE